MNKFVAPMLALAMTAGAAYAGGPVVIEEEGQPEVVANTPRSGWIVPVVVGLVLIAALASSSDDDDGGETGQ
ncbi:hypothetical protein [Rhodobacter calidifons]|uniref:Ferrochelatase n=1 Tax=Rhodobacter calidifons TaxID=2715277 RepID=A0ABX0GAD9_9RHOB|nr:hypothetical protein [Rhodobacter calidifons]NHB77817.1 hypothetical protein [Rhodobacter calidifons]